MARIESWYKQDLKKPVPIRRMETVFNQDALGHLFGVEVYSNGEPVTLAGSVTGYCLLADGTTVPVSGTRSANRASIVIPQTAYSVIGPITITVKLTEGSAITTLLAVVGVVARSRSGQQVNPGSTITDWTNQIAESLQEVEDASAAQDAKISDLKSALNFIDDAFLGNLNWVTSGYIKPDGTIKKYSNFSCTDYIFVDGSVRIKGNFYYVPEGYYYVACYDSNKDFLACLLPGDGKQNNIDEVIVLPTGTKYIRVCNYTQQIDNTIVFIAPNVNVANESVQRLLQDTEIIDNAFLVNFNWVTSGYIKPDGTVYGNVSFSCTDYIAVYGRVLISGNLWYVPSGYYYVACYDLNKSFLGVLIEGNGQQTTVNEFLTLPTGTAFIKVCNYTSQIDYFNVAVYNKISDIANEAAEAKEKTENYSSAVDKANNYMVINTYGATEWIIESDNVESVYVKAYPSVVVRGGWTSGSAYTIQWSEIISELSSYVETSPGGVTDCIKLTNSSLCLDVKAKKLVVRLTGSQKKFPDYIPLIVAWGANVIGGQIISGAIVWKHEKLITEIQEKISDGSYIPQSIKTDLISVNKTATYDYPDMPKLLWISDVHWHNDGYAYLKYLADFGQYDAVIISGDLNYYKFEQTLDATQTGMSELARIWNSYYRGKTVILPCRGNHDGHVGYTDYTSAMFANAAIKPFHDCEPDGYYYYDFDKYRIRIIMLNSCDDAQSRKGFSSQEVTWFTTALNSVPDGWSVISVSHHPIVPDINNESTLAGNSSAIVSAIQAFISNKPNCLFIAHLSGHTHVDAMEKVNGVEYVSLIDSSGDGSEYSADVICINQNTKTVNLLRSGQGKNRSFVY